LLYDRVVMAGLVFVLAVVLLLLLLLLLVAVAVAAALPALFARCGCGLSEVGLALFNCGGFSEAVVIKRVTDDDVDGGGGGELDCGRWGKRNALVLGEAVVVVVVVAAVFDAASAATTAATGLEANNDGFGVADIWRLITGVDTVRLRCSVELSGVDSRRPVRRRSVVDSYNRDYSRSLTQYQVLKFVTIGCFSNIPIGQGTSESQ
jgi:hypothetical protein